MPLILNEPSSLLSVLGEADKSMHLTLTCFSEVCLLQEGPGGVAAGAPRCLSF